MRLIHEQVFALLQTIIVGVFLQSLVIFIMDFLFLPSPGELLFGILLSAPWVFMISLFVFKRSAFRAPRSYNVAVVGFPQSGKTTLIISLFGAAFARNLPFKMMPRGSQTIELVNESLEMLDKGDALGPTEDQDLFAFRADVTFGRFPFPITYKVEFGDFPGRYSQDYAQKYGHWLHTTDFFKWVADSDAIIFVVDLGRYLGNMKSRMNYVAEMTKALRAAWQHYLDINPHRVKEVRSHPVTIAFNKADLIQRVPEGIAVNGLEDYNVAEKTIEKKIAEFGFGNKVPPIVEINPKALKRGTIQVEKDFAELIDYFRANAPNTHIVFTSSFGLLQNKRLGISDLFLSVFP